MSQVILSGRDLGWRKNRRNLTFESYYLNPIVRLSIVQVVTSELRDCHSNTKTHKDYAPFVYLWRIVFIASMFLANMGNFVAVGPTSYIYGM